MAAIRTVPVLRLSANDQLRAATLNGKRGRRHCLNLSRITARPHVLLANLHTEQTPRLRRDQPRENLHRVLRLIQRNRRDLHPRIRHLPTHRLTVSAPMVELHRPNQDRRAQHRRERVLAPALEPLKNRRMVVKLPILAHRIEPQHEAGLLHRVPPRLALMSEMLASERQPLPPQRTLRQIPRLPIMSPRRAELRGLPSKANRGQRLRKGLAVPSLDLGCFIGPVRQVGGSITRPCHMPPPT